MMRIFHNATQSSLRQLPQTNTQQRKHFFPTVWAAFAFVFWYVVNIMWNMTYCFYSPKVVCMPLKPQVQGHSCNDVILFLVTDTFRPVYLYLDIMTSYTLSPFLLTRIQTAVRLWKINFNDCYKRRAIKCTWPILRSLMTTQNECLLA